MSAVERVLNRIKRMIREWLGLGSSFIACDVSAVGRSVIVVAMRHPKGDRVKVLTVDIANIEHFDRIIDDLSRYYGVSKYNVIIDKPRFR